MEELFRFIILAVVFFRFVSWIGGIGGKKKKKQDGGVFGELQKQLEKLEENFEEAQQQAKERQAPQPITVKAKPRPKPKPKPTYPVATSAEGQSLEGQSLEITRAPYSNLEYGILDDVHQSKFEHHDITKNEIGDHEEKEKINVLEDFDPKKAFIHSLIFERKHFKI